MHELGEDQVSTEFAPLEGFQTPIAWTKLTIPQQGSVYLKRPRLIDTLDNMIDRKLILVRAPAGYGKTSLLVDLAHETDLPVCWYTVEAQHSDPSIFIAHLLASLIRRFPFFGKRVARVLQGANGDVNGQLRVFVATLVDEILTTIPEYFFVVLDDYHTLPESSSTHEFVRLLIEFMPEQCHLVIASRTVPPLPLIRLAARQQMAALGVDELRFTEQETHVLANQVLDAHLSTEQVRLLVQQTDGWITAILLSAGSGWGYSLQDRGFLSVDLTETALYEYMMSEVFSSQPAHVQQFLLHTSILNEMTVPICDQLLGCESRSMLRMLERHNVFISRIEQTGLETTYRYHPLFHEFLSSHFWQQDEAQYTDLNLRAGDLFADQQDWFTALTHYARARCFEQMREIILQHYTDLDNAGHRGSLAYWIDQLPPAYCPVRLQVKRADLANELGQYDTALRLYTNAIIRLESEGHLSEWAAVLIERSYTLSRSGSYEEAIADCQEALGLLDGQSDSDLLQGRAYRYLGMYCVESGNPVLALNYLESARRCWERCGEPATHLALLALTTSFAYEMLGQFEALLEQCHKALAIWESLKNDFGMADTLNNIGVAHHRLGRYRQALEVLHRALEKSRAAGAIRVEAYALTSLGDLYHDLGQFEPALAFYAQALAQSELLGEAYLRGYLIGAHAQTLYRTGQVERARAEVEQTLSQKTLSKSQEARQRILLADLMLHHHDSARARQELEKVLLESSVQHEVAFRGHMALAQVAMVEDQPQESRSHLQTAIRLAQEAGLTQPLSVESLDHLPVLQFVVRQNGQDEEIQRWIAAAGELERVRQELAAAGAVEGTQEKPIELRIDALGGSQVFMDGQAVSWRTKQAKELFFYLLAHPSGQTKEQIGAAMWPDHSQARLFSIFRSSLFRLRKALFADIVAFEGDKYSLTPHAVYHYDVAEFEQECTKAELADNPVQKAHHYRRAIEFYQGEFLTNMFAEWALHLREALEARYLRALTFLAGFDLEYGNYPRAIEVARRILRVDTYHEAAYCVLIKAYIRVGQRPHAKQIYDYYRNMLSGLDLEPQQDWEELCRE